MTMPMTVAMTRQPFETRNPHRQLTPTDSNWHYSVFVDAKNEKTKKATDTTAFCKSELPNAIWNQKLPQWAPMSSLSSLSIVFVMWCHFCVALFCILNSLSIKCSTGVWNQKPPQAADHSWPQLTNQGFAMSCFLHVGFLKDGSWLHWFARRCWRAWTETGETSTNKEN